MFSLYKATGAHWSARRRLVRFWLCWWSTEIFAEDDKDWCWWLKWWLAMKRFIIYEKKVKSNNWGWWTLFVYSRSFLGTKIREEWTHGELVIISLTINLWWWQWLLIIGILWHLYVIIVLLLMFVRVQRIIDHRVSNFDIDDWYRRYYYLGRYWIVTWRLGWLH